MPDPARHRALDQGAALHRIVLIISERPRDRIGHHHRSGEMQDRADPMLGDQPGGGLRNPDAVVRAAAIRDERPAACHRRAALTHVP